MSEIHSIHKTALTVKRHLHPDTVNRREALAAGFGLLTVTALTGCKPNSVSQSENKTSENLQKQRIFILVHGAWHGGWCWKYVKQYLEEQGHKVFTPTLSGLGEKSHLMSPDIGLAAHIEDIVSFIETAQIGHFTLVGHSYGGMVITGVLDKLGRQLDHIIYLDAALPMDGQSMLTQGETKTDKAIEVARKSILSLASDGIAMDVLPPHVFGIPQDHPDYEWVASQLTPHPVKTWFDPIRLKNDLPGIPKTFIHCVDPVLRASSASYHAEVLRQDSEWNVKTLNTGHDAMITSPIELSKLIEGVKTRALYFRKMI